MAAFDTSPLIPPYAGWEPFHFKLQHEFKKKGFLIRKRPKDRGKAFTLFKSHRRPFYFPGSEFWPRIRVKLKFTVVEGSIDSWQPIFAIETGKHLPRSSELEPKDCKPCKVTALGSSNRFAASGSRKFAHGDFARRAHVIIGFKAVGNSNSVILARLIKMYA